ncbi:hypothetical protein Vadar_005756 [Vaccinium darrowii]|uniref:Uncharacterized protein n=1 Tax=Vaccinium darrowii TaxID=229202 RepID=A0ACB7XFW3_9ERIC|nr:hypothetical protein Vadar_005756 [Vaccinium darrowii]
MAMDASSLSDGMDDGNETPHVLAVDDSLIDRRLVEKLLRNSSFKVTTAENGLRALEFLGLGDDQKTNGSKVNLIITDYCMPGMTGYDLLKKIKESNAMKEVPVVIVSSENIPTRIDNSCHLLRNGMYGQVLRGRGSTVHDKASQTVRRQEVEMPIDDIKKKAKRSLTR